jgi:hypothetical protein
MAPFSFPTPAISPLSQVWLEKRAVSAREEAAAGVAEEEGGDFVECKVVRVSWTEDV